MDRASSLIFPGSRTLVNWWRQLQPHHPQSLWVGYLFVHRVEAPVFVQTVKPIEPLFSLLLQAIALELNPNGVIAATLQQRLQMPSVIVHRILVGMQEAGLLMQGAALQDWLLTDLGRHALQTGHVPVRTCERRVLPFMEGLDAAGQRVAEPMFVPIADCVGAAWQVEMPHRFEVGFLRTSVAQPCEMKQTMGFPSEIDALADDASIDAAQQVLVDRPQRVMLVLIQTNKELLGFSAKVDGWTVFDREPILRLPIIARSVWPDLANEVTVTVWQDAWRSWCRQRQLPANEVDACTLTHRPPRLEVQAPPRLVQRLHAAKSDLFKGEAWILVGEGYVRTAAVLALK